MTDEWRIERVARQQLETIGHFGVDFVPIGRTSSRTTGLTTGEADAPASPARATVEAKPDGQSPEAGEAIPSPQSARLGGDGDAAAALEALRDRHANECPLCPTVPGATQVVFGEGDPYAELMFVGEGPGEEEDRTGRPFVGRAGKKLDDMIKAMGLTRDGVYIANVVKTRPPNNRTPNPAEMAQCGPYLTEQIRVIAPRVIVTLGGTATKFMLATDTGITKLRGTWCEYQAGELTVPVMPTFHPAYLLRNYTPETRRQVWSDLQAVLERLGR